MNLGARWLGWLASSRRDPVISASLSTEVQGVHTASGLCVASGVPSTGPQSRAASVLTELPPQPPLPLFTSSASTLLTGPSVLHLL